jgi:Raf kinase inhibitor-like YbhB/YbcL family protein
MLSKLYIISVLLFLLLMLMLMTGCQRDGSTAESQRQRNDGGPKKTLLQRASELRGANNPEDAKLLATYADETKSSGKLSVTSPAFKHGAPIPPTYSAYGEDVSPPLKWDKVPEGTQSFVVLMEDPDAAKPKPFIHWVLYNLPADTRELRTGIPAHARVADIGQPEQGQNSRGSIGYFGPKPPKGDPAHHYHFQVFALDRRLDVPLGAKRADILKAMARHVLAKGEVVGTFKKDAD